MSGLLALLMSPGVDHAIYAAGGALLGWWARRHPTPAAPTLPDVVPAQHVSTLEALLANPMLMAVAKLVTDRFAQQSAVAAHDALSSLAVPVAVPVAPTPKG